MLKSLVLRRLAIALASIILPLASSAQSDFGLWTDAEAQFNLSRKWELAIEAGLRTRSGLSAFDRWSLGASAEFAPVKPFSVGIGYQFLDSKYDSYLTSKGNIVNDYWRIRNRFFGQFKLKFRPSILKLDFRFRYQLTHKSMVSIAKYSAAGVRKSNEVKDADNEGLLRSRISLGFKTKTLLTPAISYELFNDFGDGFALDKQRLTLGTDIRLSKHNELNVSYVRNIFSGSNDTDRAHNVLSIGYKFKL